MWLLDTEELRKEKKKLTEFTKHFLFPMIMSLSSNGRLGKQELLSPETETSFSCIHKIPQVKEWDENSILDYLV